MKLLSAQQLREADAYTIAHEPITSLDLMERASQRFVQVFEEVFVNSDKAVSIFCGTGNNGGDGLAIARLLHQKGWQVECFLIQFSQNISPDNQTNQQRLTRAGLKLQTITNKENLPHHIHPIIIDALVGTGISRPLDGLLKKTVALVNASSSIVCSIDLPSGLFDQGDCSYFLEQLIHADYTFTFHAPKRNFLLPDYGLIIGQWKVLDIGLNKPFIASLSCEEFFITEMLIRSFLLSRPRFSHKGTYGHSALLCGSKGMLGAAILSTKACLRSGAGLTTIFTPECGNDLLQATCPEAICITTGTHYLNQVVNLESFNSVGIGPGIGQHSETRTTLLSLIEKNDIPLVLDADALNLLHESDLHCLHEHSILTPHPKEFSRLFGETTNATAQLNLLRAKAKEYSIYILLKGQHSVVAGPDGSLFFNSTGNPGMAKGGSGDVLTGLITGLLARGYSAKEASILGVYIHGLAGDLAAKHTGMEGMTSLDLIDFLPKAFQQTYNQETSV